MGFLVGSVAKNLPASVGDTGDAVRSLSQEDPWRRKWQPTPVFLLKKNPMDRGAWWGHKESDRLSTQTHTYDLAMVSLPMNDWVPTQGLKTLHENILLYKEKANCWEIARQNRWHFSP